MSYRLNFAGPIQSSEQGIKSASIRQSDLRLAMVRHDGVLFLADLGNPSADAQADLNVAGVAWSNAGDRLAVVRRDPNNANLRLEILTPELRSLQAFPLDLADFPDGISWRYQVSWSADDSRVVVAVDLAFWAGFMTPPSGIAVVSIDDGSTLSGNYTSAWFVGTNMLVARPPLNLVPDMAPGMVLVLKVARDGLREVQRISGPRYLVGSNPTEGVFATIEPSFIGAMPTLPIGLRTVPAGPDLVTGFGTGDPSASILLVPLETARPVLQRLGAAP